MEFRINTQATDFDLRNAHHLAGAAAGAYLSGTAAFRGTFDNWRDVDLITDPVSGTQCFVATTDQVVVVAFRGTFLEVQDFLVDLNIVQEPGYGGRVHAGDKLAFEAVWDEVHALARTRLDGGRALCITGHSLGGALTSLAAWRFNEVGLLPAQVYTYGSPRVGNRAFVKHHPVTMYRVVNRRDLVPHLPPQHSGLSRLWDMVLDVVKGLGPIDYQHAGALCYIDPDGRLREDTDDVAIFLEGLAQELTAYSDQKLEEVEDHSITEYIAGLRALLPA